MWLMSGEGPVQARLELPQDHPIQGAKSQTLCPLLMSSVSPHHLFILGCRCSGLVVVLLWDSYSGSPAGAALP